MQENNDRKRKGVDESINDLPVATERLVKPKLSSVIAKISTSPKTNDVRAKYIEKETNKSVKIKSPIVSIERPVVNDFSTTNDVSLQRNKRIFAGIMGHLGQARERLQKDSLTIEKQTTIKAAISQKQVEGARIAAELKRQIREREKEMERLQAKTDVAEGKINAIKLRHESYKVSQEKLRYFLQVSSEPRILWLPKLHNSATKLLLNARQIQVTTLITEREVEVTKELEPLQSTIKGIQQRLEQLISNPVDIEAYSNDTSEGRDDVIEHVDVDNDSENIADSDNHDSL